MFGSADRDDLQEQLHGKMHASICVAAQMDKNLKDRTNTLLPVLNLHEELKRLDPFAGTAAKALSSAMAELDRLKELSHADQLTSVRSLAEMDLQHPMHQQIDAALGARATLEEQERLAKQFALDASGVLHADIHLSSLGDIAKQYQEHQHLAGEVAKAEAYRNLVPRIADLVGTDKIIAEGIATDFRQYVDRLREQETLATKAFLNPPAADLAKYLNPSVDDFLNRHRETYAAAFGTSSASETLIAAVERMHEPWLQTGEPERSVKAMFDLSAIGAALQNPLSGSLNDLVRHEFGDWSRITRFPAQIVANPQARLEFYLEHGFNPELLQIPDHAYDDALAATGVAEAGEDDTLSVVVVPTEEAAEFEVNQRLYGAFFQLENGLRDFIERQMSRHFGSDWYEHFAPRVCLVEWKRNKQADFKKTGRELPLLHYSNFSDLEHLIINNLARVFGPFFSDLEEQIDAMLKRLRWVRNDIAHHRPVTPADRAVAWTHIRQIKACLVIH